jgi:transposase
LIARGERRRRWTIEQKQTIAAQSLAPGASPTEVARQYGISGGQLYTWRHALLAAQPEAVTHTPGRFARVELKATRMLERVSQEGAIEAPSPVPQLLANPTAQPSGRIEIVLPDGTAVRMASTPPRWCACVLARCDAGRLSYWREWNQPRSYASRDAH